MKPACLLGLRPSDKRSCSSKKKPLELFLRRNQQLRAFMAFTNKNNTTTPQKKRKTAKPEIQLPPSLEGLGTVEKNATHWNTNKTSSRETGKAYHVGGFEKLADRVSKCAAFLTFERSVNTSSGELFQRLKKVEFCKARFCAVCMWRRSMFWIARFKTALPEIEEAHPNGRWLFLTLTVKNVHPDNLKETLKQMSKGWHRMTSRVSWPALGFIRSTEITRNKKTNEAHPHFHALLFVPAGYFAGKNYKKKEWWANEWKTAMNLDYEPIVDIRTAKPKGDKTEAESVAVEVLKYSVKPSDLNASPAWLCAITQQAKGARYLSTGGILKNAIKDDVSEEEMREIDPDKVKEESEEVLEEIRYFYYPKFKQYARQFDVSKE